MLYQFPISTVAPADASWDVPMSEAAFHAREDRLSLETSSSGRDCMLMLCPAEPLGCAIIQSGESRIGERKSRCFQAAYLRTDRITKWVCMKEKAQAMPGMRMIVRRISVMKVKRD